MKYFGNWFRFRKVPDKLFRLGGHNLVVWYQNESDGSPVLNQNARWWKISGGLFWYGKYEIIFRRRGIRGL